MATAIKIKLVVDRSRRRVLFADAGSDFVDVLLGLLTLPLSAVRFHAGEASVPGCLANLCGSVEHLRLTSAMACFSGLRTPKSSGPYSIPECHWCNDKEEENCRCWQVKARLMHVYGQVSSTEMFVRGGDRFVIGDDCVIKPASTVTVLSLLQRFGTDGIKDGFEELDVCVGWSEVPYNL
ncbi:hypothetical protein ACP70R_002426 [Stipagrostis hirtigluma subsp. patula]